jgi:hypothetical protein
MGTEYDIKNWKKDDIREVLPRAGRTLVRILSNFAHDLICALLAHYPPKPSRRAQAGRKTELLRSTCALGFSH